MQPTPNTQVNPRKPDDFIKIANDAGAQVDPGHGPRVVVRFNGKTLGFSRHGNQEYPKRYRLILKKAYIAMGLLILIGFLIAHSLPL